MLKEIFDMKNEKTKYINNHKKLLFMNIKIVEDKKNRLVFEMPGLNQTVPNLLRSELWNNEETKNTGYHVTHPIAGHPIFVLETKSKEARKVLDEAIKGIVKQLESAREDLKGLR